MNGYGAVEFVQTDAARVSLLSDTPKPYEKYAMHNRVILPNTKWLKYWDLLVFIALVWTATGTVYDVMIISARERSELMSFPFRTLTLDAIFLTDTVLTCFRAYRTRNGRGRLITDLKTIQTHYIYSRQFVIDVLSCIPFDAIAKVLSMIFETNRIAFYLKMLSLLRLLRLGRLFRKVRQSRFYLKLEQEYNSSVVVLTQLFIITCLLVHWMACTWVWIGIEESYMGYSELSWLSRMKPPIDPENIYSAELYIIALYWSVTTVTTIGYGDITPGTMPEFVVSIVLEIVGAFIFTYTIGVVAGAIAVMEQNRTERRQKIDSLNRAIAFSKTTDAEEAIFPPQKVKIQEEAQRYRDFTHRLLLSREYKKRKAYNEIEDILSPGLRNTLLFSYYQDTLRRVRLFRQLNFDDLREVAAICKVMSFPNGEVITPQQLNCIGIVQRGVGSRIPSQRILAPGSVFGQDTFALSMKREGDIEIYAEEDSRKIKVMTFFQVLTLDFTALKVLCDSKPSLRDHFRNTALRLMLVRWARSIILKERQLRPKRLNPLKTHGYSANGYY